MGECVVCNILCLNHLQMMMTLKLLGSTAASVKLDLALREITDVEFGARRPVCMVERCIDRASS